MKNYPFFVFFHVFLFVFISCNSGTNSDLSSVQKSENKKDTVVVVLEQKQAQIDVLMSFVTAAIDDNYELLPVGKWNTNYFNSIEVENCVKTDSILLLPSNTRFWAVKSMKMQNTQSQKVPIVFDSAQIRVIVMRKKTSSSMRPDFKLTEFSFKDSIAASLSHEEFKRISTYTIKVRGLKSPNVVWQYKNKIYLLRVRAAAFSTDYGKNTFDKKIGKIKIINRM